MLYLLQISKFVHEMFDRRKTNITELIKLTFEVVIFYSCLLSLPSPNVIHLQVHSLNQNVSDAKLSNSEVDIFRPQRKLLRCN